MKRAGGSSVDGNGALHPAIVSASANNVTISAATKCKPQLAIAPMPRVKFDSPIDARNTFSDYRAPLRPIHRDTSAGNPARPRRREHHHRIRNLIRAPEPSRRHFMADKIFFERGI